MVTPPTEVIIVHKNSELELYRDSPDENTRRWVQDGPKTQEFQDNHAALYATLELVQAVVRLSGISFSTSTRKAFHKKLMDGFEITAPIIAIGGDGTLLEPAHYIKDTWILGVNANPSQNGDILHKSVGYLMACDAKGFPAIWEHIETTPSTTIDRMEISIDNIVQREQAVNDVCFLHANGMGNVRYRLRANDKEQEERGSGLLLATPAGSTAWIHNLDGTALPLDFWDLEYKILGKRGEKVRYAQEMQVTSYTREGMLFVDGQHLQKPLSFGQTAVLRRGNPLTLIGDLKEKQKRYQ